MKRSCLYIEFGSQWSVVFYVQSTCLFNNELRDRPDVSATIGTIVETLLLFISLLTKWGLHRPILESSFTVKYKTIHKLFRCIGRISHSGYNTGRTARRNEVLWKHNTGNQAMDCPSIIDDSLRSSINQDLTCVGTKLDTLNSVQPREIVSVRL